MTVDAALAAVVADAVAPLEAKVERLTAAIEALKAASPERMGTVNELARLRGVSPQTIRRQIAEGAIRSVRIGRSIRIDLCASLKPIVPATVAELAYEARK